MEFNSNFDLETLLPSEFCKISNKLEVIYRPNPNEHGEVSKRYTSRTHQLQILELIDKLGQASAASQQLNGLITSGERLRNSEHWLYVMKDKQANRGRGAVLGVLKVGRKKLYIHDHRGGQHELTPLSILDFYIHESKQRRGYGKLLFDYMLMAEEVEPQHLAIDKPSEKFMNFLMRHYDLYKIIPQTNNYVIFEGFFAGRPDPFWFYHDYINKSKHSVINNNYYNLLENEVERAENRTNKRQLIDNKTETTPFLPGYRPEDKTPKGRGAALREQNIRGPPSVCGSPRKCPSPTMSIRDQNRAAQQRSSFSIAGSPPKHYEQRVKQIEDEEVYTNKEGSVYNAREGRIYKPSTYSEVQSPRPEARDINRIANQASSIHIGVREPPRRDILSQHTSVEVVAENDGSNLSDVGSGDVESQNSQQEVILEPEIQSYTVAHNKQQEIVKSVPNSPRLAVDQHGNLVEKYRHTRLW